MKRNNALRTGVVALVLLALLCAPALARTVSPGSDFYYLDKANVLSEALEGEIYFSNQLLYDACGAQIVVVTVDSTGNEAIDDYAYELFNSWGIGDAAKNNGFLLLLAIGDEDYYATTGSGIDRSFSASTIKQFYDDYLEYDFAMGDYESGVKQFFEAVFARIAQMYNAKVTTEQGIRAYKDYVAQNSAAKGFGGYNGSRRAGAANRNYGSGRSSMFGTLVLLTVILIIVLVVIMSKGRSARRRVNVMPPPPPPGAFGYRPTRTVYHSGISSPPPRSRPSSGWSSLGSSRSSSGGSSFGGFGSRSRSSFGGSSRSSGFGGGHSGGGRTSGGGAGRGRH